MKFEAIEPFDAMLVGGMPIYTEVGVLSFGPVALLINHNSLTCEFTSTTGSILVWAVQSNIFVSLDSYISTLQLTVG